MDAPTFDGIDVPEWKCQQPLEPEGAPTMQITTIGIDRAKNVFQIHGADQRGKAVLRKQLRRDQVAPFFANLQPWLIGIEACSSAHHWARKLQALGHTVRLMAPQFVKPYVKSNKNDVADAEAIIEQLKGEHGDPLDASMTSTERELAAAFQRLLEEDLYWAVVHTRWIDDAGWARTREAFFGALPLPLR